MAPPETDDSKPHADAHRSPIVQVHTVSLPPTADLPLNLLMISSGSSELTNAML